MILKEYKKDGFFKLLEKLKTYNFKLLVHFLLADEVQLVNARDKSPNTKWNYHDHDERKKYRQKKYPKHQCRFRLFCHTFSLSYWGFQNKPPASTLAMQAAQIKRIFGGQLRAEKYSIMRNYFWYYPWMLWSLNRWTEPCWCCQPQTDCRLV